MTLTRTPAPFPILAPHDPGVFGNRVFVSGLTHRQDFYNAMGFGALGGSGANRLMYDSTSLFAIPSMAQMVASYLTGYPQSQAAWDRFKGRPEIRIVQHSGVWSEGDVLDVEPGCALVADCHPFIKTRKSMGYDRPTIYCSQSWVPGVRKATAEFRLGIDYDLWVADWTGSPHVGYPGSAATQYASTHSYDLTSVNDPAWPHRTKPVPTPVPVPVPSSIGYRQVADGGESLAAFEAKRWKVPAASTANIEAARLTVHMTLDHDAATAGEKSALIDYLVHPGIYGLMPKGMAFYTLSK